MALRKKPTPPARGALWYLSHAGRHRGHAKRDSIRAAPGRSGAT